MIGKGQELKKNETYNAFRFRLRPSKEQETLLDKHFGCTRFIYNHFLNKKKEHYLNNKETLKFGVCVGSLVAKKKEEGFE